MKHLKYLLIGVTFPIWILPLMFYVTGISICSLFEDKKDYY